MIKNYFNSRYEIYNVHQIRLCSFRHYWATVDSKRRLVMEMADAGFFYCGSGLNDKVMCFSCGGGIEDWEYYDDPWMQHAICFPDCFYLNAVKGTDYVDKSKHLFFKETRI